MRIVYDEGPGGVKKTFPFDRSYLAFYLDRQAEFAAKRRAPLFAWAFGAIRGCFENGRGGEGWLEDVTRLFEERGLHWTVWSYRDESFGIRDNPAARRVLSRAAGRASASVR